MNTTGTLSYAAADRKNGITLGELEDVVRSARLAGVSRDSRIRVGIGWSQQIHTLNIEDRRDAVALWPVVTITHAEQTWVLPNLINAPIGMVAAVQGNDAGDFLRTLESFAGKEFAEMVSGCSPQEFEEIMLAWEKASVGE